MIYRVTVSLISPLHIGTGQVLLRDYDFKVVGNRTWVLNQDAILADAYDRAGARAEGPFLTLPPGQLVADRELREGSPFVRYALDGTTTVDQVREQIKDVYGRPYLPGSSLKGALRTVLMGHALRSGFWKPDLSALGDRREWAAQPWERAVFGPDPNRDLMRALRVADSDPLPLSPSPLMLLNAQVFTADGRPGSPIVVEALKPDTVFHTTMTLDEFLFSDAARALRFADRREWLTGLAQIAREVSRARIEREQEWYRSHPSFQKVLSLYHQLAQARLGPNAFLLQIGWGAGWTAKSVGFWLPRGAQDSLRRRYKLGKPPRAGRDWQPNLARPFPRSRRLRARRSQNQVLPDWPLGWVLVEMEEVR
ncbi:MAG: type III-A CRISPR-associated RAMP protein Csm5 [Anaerolineae bacterium]